MAICQPTRGLRLGPHRRSGSVVWDRRVCFGSRRRATDARRAAPCAAPAQQHQGHVAAPADDLLPTGYLCPGRNITRR